MIEFGDWQVRRADALNLTLYHRHEKRGRGKDAAAEDNGTLKWFPTGNYFHSVEAACMFALKTDVRNGVGGEDERQSMADFIKRIESLMADQREWLSGVSARL